MSKPNLRTNVQIMNISFALNLKSYLIYLETNAPWLLNLRAGILPLSIEVGQFNNILEGNRLCELGVLDGVESEGHILLLYMLQLPKRGNIL